MLIACLTSLLGALAPVQDCHFELVDVGMAGEPGNHNASRPHISGDGNCVLFLSTASNLVPGDAPGSLDLFVRDRSMGSIERINEDAAGNVFSVGEAQCDFSHDGRFVVFKTWVGLDPADQVPGLDIYLRDRVLGTTEWISKPWTTGGETGSSHNPRISGDGRYVSFDSNAKNLVPNDTNNVWDVFVRDRLLGTTILVSQSTQGESGDYFSWRPQISQDGRRVAFVSQATNLTPQGPDGPEFHAYVRDLELGTTISVDVTDGGVLADGIVDQSLYLSPDGTRVVFGTLATNLGGGTSGTFMRGPFIRAIPGGVSYVPMHDGRPGRWSGRGASFSRDNRFLAFDSGIMKWWVPGATSGVDEIYLHDFVTGVTSQIAKTGPHDTNGSPGFNPTIANDAQGIAFKSQSPDFVTGGLPWQHAYVRVCDPEGGLAYCLAMQSPSGCRPWLYNAGLPGAGGGFELRVRGAPSEQIGVLSYSTTASAALPWSAGYLCIQAPLLRLPPMATGSSAGVEDCEGALIVDFDDWMAAGADPALVPGVNVYAQAWLRAPELPQGGLLSNAFGFHLPH